MEPEGADFQDWEVLHSAPLTADVADTEETSGFLGDSEGMIQNNYFSFGSKKAYVGSDDSEVSSENPSWIDPAFETEYPRKLSAESWSDSGSERFTEFEGKVDVGFVCNDQSDRNLGEFVGGSSGACSGEMVVESGVGIGDSGVEEDVILGEECSEREGYGEKGGSGVGKDEEKRKISGVVWWKLPIELLRYCVFKGPVWTVSVAAAFMGFVILGRRLYRMKKKSSALGARITMDDNKKISQFMTRAARLNDAFSVVKRVPMIRPSLPAVGATPWPVASLR